MAFRRGIQAIAVMLTLPSSMPAQNRDTITTRLVIGAGPKSTDQGWVPVYSVGVERRPAASNITFRLSMAVWEAHESSADQWWQMSNGVDAELVGIRHFGHRRLQPYFYAGAGIHTRGSTGRRPTFTLTDSGFVTGPPIHHYSYRATRPSVIWGVGTNVRIGSAAVFAELRLPVWYYDSPQYGLLTPLMAGIRF